MIPHPVFDGDHLNAVVFRPRRKKLFVSFRQRVGHAGVFDEPKPVMGFLRAGFAHLHLQSRVNDWFINSETEALEARLARFLRRYEEVVTMGFSMGGYGALRFARVLRAQTSVVISPQVSIDPALVPFDRRYRKEAKGWDTSLGDLTTRGTELRGAILVDPFKRNDFAHAQMIREIFPRMTLVRLPNGGHPATRALRQGGRFNWLKTELAQGLPEPQEIARQHRAVRHRSELYWQHLALVARGHGHYALAETADARAAALGGDADKSLGLDPNA
jgi:pimeloyl-ACP methyl ester carboxylesterase